MKRRAFLSSSVQAGLGTLLLPSAVNSCNGEPPFNSISYSGRVVIIGAGIAGIYAGYLLQEQGIDFTILEASDRIGGRMGKNEDFADFPIDTGAQWLHSDFSILGSLAKTTGTEVFYDNAEASYWHQGELKGQMPDVIAQILEGLEKATEDISFKEYFYNKGATDEEYNLLVALAGDVGASPENISVKWEQQGYELTSYGDEDYKFKKTFFDFVNEQLISKVSGNVQTNTVVKSIDYQTDSIKVTDKDGQEHAADKVIITVPITVLKDRDIDFSPALPQAKTESFQQLGMEAGIRAFLRFSEPITDRDLIGGSVCAAYVYESYNRDTNDHILFGFAMGNQAVALSDMGETAAVQALLAELDTMTDGKASASYQGHFFQDWYKAPFVRGAYSYPLVGATENTRKNIAASVENKLFFAGEATNYNGHHQTVHGAVESAYREVLNILENI